MGLTYIVVLFTSAAPSPIYPVYQQLWGFSSFMVTVVFAVYVAALLVTLLTVGSISDHVGRKPVLIVSLAVLIVSMVVFIEASSLGELIAARVVQGLATGAILGTLSATLLDMAPSERLGTLANGSSPGLGLATGSILAGVLVQYAPAPRVTVYVVAAVMMALLILVILAIPESSARIGFESRRHLATTLRPSLSLPAEARGAFLAGTPAMIATWALGGLQLSLGSSIVARIFGIHNHAAAGITLALFFIFSALGAAGTIHLAPMRKLAVGYPALFIGVCFTLAAVETEMLALFVVGGLISGVGFGAGFSGATAMISAATAPADRGKVFSTMFIVAYTGFALPAVIAGILVEHIGLSATTAGYAVFVMALAVLASVAAIMIRRSARRTAPGREPTLVTASDCETECAATSRPGI
ncbi:MFS transporter [Gordonia jinhuaensis]|uniref:MFS transporter n=1 Tax=Gordonia jinhuaensis TaxID=1517702 RepID=A0A916WPJ7_9ACTN|nr:MFS transporter [Gordonia jinhuaensis]GGB20444.1 MFS transporter [Gordonia jinhuaensis]